MRRVLVRGFTLMAFVIASLVVARPAAACSCMPLDTLADWVGEIPGGALVVGEAVADHGDGTSDFKVARWYGGTDRRPLIVIRTSEGGANVMDSCATHLPLDHRLSFYGIPDAEGIYRLGYCSLIRDPADEEGMSLERDAARLIGLGQAPLVPPEPTAPPRVVVAEQAVDPAIDPLILAGVMIAAAGVLFGAVILVRLRRGSGRT